MSLNDLKNRLPLFPQDRLAHYQWASWFSAIAATVAVLVLAPRLPFRMVLLAGVAASVLCAVLLGLLGEYSDQRANQAAAAAGEPAPHSVSEGDVWASALGCLPSALPLLALYFLLAFRAP